MPKDEEVSLEIESGVSLFTKEGFCTVRLNGKALGQLTPDGVREMALAWLGAAEAAETDAALYAMLKSMDLDDETVGRAIAGLRNYRNGSGTKEK